MFYHTWALLHDDEMEEWTSNTKVRVEERNVRTTDVIWVDGEKRRRDMMWMSGVNTVIL